MPGTRGSRWELMSAHVTRRCHSAPAPPGPPSPPQDSPPDQTGLPIPGWGKSSLQVGQALPAAGAVPRQRDRDPELPAGASPGRQPLCCGSSSTVSFIPFRDRAFPKTPKTFALLPGHAVGRRGRCSDAFCGTWGETPGGRRPEFCSKPPAGAVQSPMERDRTGANRRRLHRQREHRSKGRSALPRRAHGDLPAWAGGTSATRRQYKKRRSRKHKSHAAATVPASPACRAAPGGTGLWHGPRSTPGRRSGSI